MTARSRTPFFVAGLMAALVLGLGLGAAAFAVLDDSTTTIVRQVTVEGSEPVAAGGISTDEDLRQRIEGRRRDRGAGGSGFGGSQSKRAGIRVRGRREGTHRDEPARRRRSLVDLGELLERRRAQRNGRRHGSVDRPRRAPRRCAAVAPRAAPLRRFERGRRSATRCSRSAARSASKEPSPAGSSALSIAR